MKTKSITFLLALALLLFGTILNAQIATAPGAGDGSSGSPYEIATLDNLYWITQNDTEWGKHYIQTANINASLTSDWDLGAGFTPIGNGDTKFTGTYDGQTHTIDALTISRSDKNEQGMFGYVNESGTIKNLGVTNVNILGKTSTGGLVGRGDPVTITDCYSTGTVQGGPQYTGGLIGFPNNVTITRCYSTANVTGGQFVGGLAGYTLNSSEVKQCYSTGNVTGTGTDRQGGLLGAARGTVTNCYSTSAVNGTNRVGGLIGRNYATVTNCYSSGSVTASGSQKGGFIGYATAGTVTDCFWDTETSGQATSYGGTGKTTAEMKTEVTFTGWDFATVWQITGTNYPDLRNNSNPALPVELTSFTATKIAGGVLLNWTTATEVNNYGFEVEAEVSGSWLNVGFVEGHGNSNSPKEYSYIDNSVATSYRLKQVDTDGGFEYSNLVTVAGNSVNKLSQNYPNPFNPSTQISYSIAKAQNVNISVYNALGQKVAELVNTKMNAGTHSVNFNGSNLASGLYFYKLTTPNYTKTMKMLLLK